MWIPLSDSVLVDILDQVVVGVGQALTLLAGFLERLGVRQQGFY